MFHLDTLATLVAATLTLLLGRKLVHCTEKKHGLGSQL